MAAYDEKDKKDNFNSRPSARGDDGRAAHASVRERFQFTPLREGRRTALCCGQRHPPISIHAPPRGATAASCRPAAASCNFNSRPSARGDTTSSFTRTNGLEFQFTPLREGRPDCDTEKENNGYFNSRPSARGDMKKYREKEGIKFQFTPLREGRRQKICNFCKSFVQPLQISMA